jgi:hypothetical protein
MHRHHTRLMTIKQNIFIKSVLGERNYEGLYFKTI